METFFSEKNKDLLYNLVRDDVYRKTKYNIDEHRKYSKTFKEIMKIVYKHAEFKNNLNELNKSVLGKSIPYLVDIINKKNLKIKPLLPSGDNPNIVPNKMLDGKDNNDLYGDVNIQQRINQINDDREKLFSNTLRNKTDISNGTNFENLDSSNDFTMDNFNLNEPLKQDLGNDIYNESTNPMDLFEQYNLERNKQDTEYKQLQDKRTEFERNNDIKNNIVENNLEERNNIMEGEWKEENVSLQINDFMSKANIPEIKGQLDNKIFITKDVELPTANDNIQSNKLQEQNRLYQELKKNMFKEKKYINRETFISINSGDRDWYNNSSENRFNFQVKFDDSGNTSSANIPRRFKNVVSFEIVRALIPMQNLEIPFNHNIYMGLKTLPYLVLKIDEIQGLYAGTNKNTDKAFCKLLWDKDQGETIYKFNSDPGGDTFDRQYKRGYCLMTPLGFEKKTYYPSPLASLDSLSLNLVPSHGHSISKHPDVVTINTIHAITDANKHIKKSIVNIPYKDKDIIIKITLLTYVSNRFFKIGDNIIIRNYENSNKEIENFLNREEGHYIINLQQEDSTGTTSNAGFINEIYIPTNIQINYSDTNSTDSDGIHTGEISGLDNASTGTDISGGTPKLINQSLQTNLVFKLTIREDDATSVMNSINV